MVLILGVPVDNLSMAETLDRLEGFIRVGRKSGKGHQVATVNVDFIVNARHDLELLYMLQNVSMALPDGMPLVWGARCLGASVAERVAGVDVVFRLAERAAQKGYSIYLLGAAPGVAAQAAEILQKKNPGLMIVGIRSPMIRSIEETDPAIIEDICLTRPDILLVAFGNPKQEKWIARYSQQLHVPVMIGVGGTFDFISGTKKRAPKWMQNSGLEWTYRLVQEPGRLWRRYCRDIIVFGQLFIKQWWQMRPSDQKAATLLINNRAYQGDVSIISVNGRLSVNNIQTLSRLIMQALVLTKKVAIDLSQVANLDASALGALVSLTRQVRDLGGELALINIPPPIWKTLNFLRLDRVFQFTLDPAHGLDPVAEIIKPELG